VDGIGIAIIKLLAAARMFWHLDLAAQGSGLGYSASFNLCVRYALAINAAVIPINENNDKGVY
jgi:hypothetical protein